MLPLPPRPCKHRCAQRCCCLLQVRLLALELSDELFPRSKLFRALLSARFTQFLELVVGLKAGTPLPPPISAATALREHALAAIARWDAQHGAKCRQVALGHAYLRNTLRLQFPDINTRASQQEDTRQRQEVCLLAMRINVD